MQSLVLKLSRIESDEGHDIYRCVRPVRTWHRGTARRKKPTKGKKEINQEEHIEEEEKVGQGLFMKIGDHGVSVQRSRIS